MKKEMLLIVTLMISSYSYCQSGEFSTYDLRNVMTSIGFKPIKYLKDLDSNKTIQIFNSIEADTPMLKQLNIDSWFYCDFKKIDNFSTYNYYYQDISRSTFDKYCKEINALMMLDGVINQPK